MKRGRVREKKWGRKGRREEKKSKDAQVMMYREGGKWDKNRVILTLASSDGQNDSSRTHSRVRWGSSHYWYMGDHNAQTVTRQSRTSRATVLHAADQTLGIGVKKATWKAW